MWLSLHEVIQYNTIQLYCLCVEKFAFWLVIYMQTFNKINDKTSTIYIKTFNKISIVHGCMVYTERAEMVAVSCGPNHASAVNTPLRWIFKCAL